MIVYEYVLSEIYLILAFKLNDFIMQFLKPAFL